MLQGISVLLCILGITWYVSVTGVLGVTCFLRVTWSIRSY